MLLSPGASASHSGCAKYECRVPAAHRLEKAEHPVAERHVGGADRQLEAFEKRKDLRDVVDYIIAETEYGIPL